MKNIIKVMVLPLIIINSFFAAQTKQEFSTSIFWQAPVSIPSALPMFSENNPNGLAYGKLPATVNPEQAAAALSSQIFGFYVAGTYFSGTIPTFYMTFPKKPQQVASKIKNKKPTPVIDLNLSQIRLGAIGVVDYTDNYVGTIFNNSLTALFKLVPISEYLYNQHYQYVYGNGSIRQVLLDFGIFPSLNGTDYLKIWQKYNPKNAFLAPASETMGRILSQVSQSSLFMQQTNLTVQSFIPVAGINMQGSTYFDQDNILFALHLITPGKGTAKLTENTSVADIMQYQNTYTDMYSLEGITVCGDNFGF